MGPGWAAPAAATIHPIVQSVLCASAQVGDPRGQTPLGLQQGLVTESFGPAPVPGTATVTFSEPVTFDKSDFRALIATGVVIDVVTDADGNVTALVVAFSSEALSGEGGDHCNNG
jgi:hypothetical protein